MKTVICVFVVCLSCLAASATAQGIGRYQIVAGTYGVDENQRPTIIKIDTVTGETWELMLLQVKKGQFVNGWSPLSGNVLEDFKKVEAVLNPKD